MLYPIIRSLVFNFDAEKAHYFSMDMLRVACNVDFIRSIITKQYQYKSENLKKEIFGISFKNPVGLGAGFDKNALYLRELEALGFGFIEIGTVTPKPQQGNDKPRLFRLPKDKALINRMGFNNNGVKAIAGRLRERKTTIVVGGNIGKNKTTPNGEAWRDYEICFRGLFDCVDYFVVNVSSPNTPGLRELQEKESLKKILSNLQTINQGKSKSKPLLLKIAPDLSKEQLNDIISLVDEVKLDGLVATNTTISRNSLKTPFSEIGKIGNGGLSGKPIFKKSTEIVTYLSQQLNNRIPIIASGGIFNGTDAEEKFKAGASLVQLWTGFVYEGPGVVKKILKHINQHKS